MIKIKNWKFGEQIVTFVRQSLCKKTGNFFYAQGDHLYFIKTDSEAYPLNYEGTLSDLQSGDILTVLSKGTIQIDYRVGMSDVDIFVTNRCNSNCVMCPLSESVRRKKDPKRISWIYKFIHTLPEDIEYINITGGEPTLVGEDFFKIMGLLKEKFQHAGFQLLTNGRSMADEYFLRRTLPYLPYGIRFAIPMHASNARLHDEITRAKGSFYQTDRGIHNLLKYQQKVELRIVLSKKNIEDVFHLANYITEQYKGIFCVNFIAMEMMGCAAVHRKELWIDYSEAFQKIKKAIDWLVIHGIDVQLYNFPLCAIEHGYWQIAVKSITDYKIRYMPECTQCQVKDICGGFFYSTKQLMKPKVTPIG